MVAAALISTVIPARSGNVVLSAVADATAFENNPGNNLGGQAFMPIGNIEHGGRGRGLIRFDLSTIPANATITSVSMSVTITKVGHGATTATYDLRRLLHSWGEGNKSGQGGGFGAPAGTGESSWNSSASPTAWASPGGLSGSDFSGSVSSSTDLGPSGSFTFNSTATLVSDVQSWVGTPGANFGWMILCENESSPAVRWVGSREGGQAAQLSVAFSLPAPALVITNASPLAGGIYGMPYSQTLMATGGTPSYAWSVVSGALPGGLNLNASSGVLAGTPNAAGAFSFTVRATDSASVTTNKAFALSISALAQPTITGLAKVGNAVRFSFATTAGQSYGVEYRDAFTNTNLWTALTNFGVQATAGTLSATNAISGSKQFYRIRTP